MKKKEEKDEGYSLEADIQCIENLHNLHNDSPLFSEIMKIERVLKLAANLHDIDDYVIHIRNLKQPLNHGLVLKKLLNLIKNLG